MYKIPERSNPWCDFCKETTPERNEACTEPCEDFLAWCQLTQQDEDDPPAD